ncbi:hypothetical protein MTR_8g037075 [Medicago truncatula]|uniref:Uncharacterized protein n=1 Tax=Medicago truncatula TaxID=3880 RepID=A0A072TZU6_MEDTR|nr:hypothetical protein MTR_8g037075 [Medicago truncatula]
MNFVRMEKDRLLLMLQNFKKILMVSNRCLSPFFQFCLTSTVVAARGKRWDWVFKQQRMKHPYHPSSSSSSSSSATISTTTTTTSLLNGKISPEN